MQKKNLKKKRWGEGSTFRRKRQQVQTKGCLGIGVLENTQSEEWAAWRRG